MRKTYSTLSEATNDLKARGYEEDFNFKPDCVECNSLQLKLNPEDLRLMSFTVLKECLVLMTIVSSLPSLLTKV